MGPLLTLYCIAEIAGPVLAAFFILAGVLVVGQLVAMLDVLLAVGVGAGDFARLIAYLSPNLFVLALPMAALLGVTLALSRMTADGEVMALKACGTGVGRLLPPVALVAVVVAGATGWLTIHLAPAGESASRQLLLHLAREKIGRGLLPQRFSEGTGALVLYVDETTKDGAARGVYVADVRDASRPVVMVARRGRIQADPAGFGLELTLEDGSLHRDSGATTQTVLFDSYRVFVPLPLPRRVAGEDLTKRNRHELGLADLAARAEKGDADGLSCWVEYQRRLALPVGAALLTCLGLPLGLLARPGRRAVGLPLSIFFFIAYFAGFSGLGGLAESGAVAAGVAFWGFNLLFLLLFGLLFGLTASPLLDLLFEAVDRLFFGLARRLGREV